MGLRLAIGQPQWGLFAGVTLANGCQDYHLRVILKQLGIFLRSPRPDGSFGSNPSPFGNIIV